MKKIAKFSAAIAFVCLVFAIVYPIDTKVTKIYSKFNGYSTAEQESVLGDMYWYNNLNENEKKAYSSIHAAILDFPQRIPISKVGATEIENIFQALSYDNPEFFFLGNSSTFVSSGYVHFFVPQYTMTKEAYNGYIAQLDGKLEQIRVATAGVTDYEKELYVHDYMIANCEYNDNASDTRLTAYGAIINNQANCEGYSRGTQFLLNELGVKTRVIIGEVSNSTRGTEGHMWNIVTIEGKEYNFDVTWDDHHVNGVSSQSTPPSHMYMNIPTSEIAITHTASNEKYNSSCIYNDASYYKMNGSLFSYYDNNAKRQIVDEIAKQVANGGNNIEIKFDNKQAYDTAMSKMFKGQEIYRLISLANLKSSKKIGNDTVNYTSTPEKYIIRIFFIF